MELKTKRLVLREWERKDAKDLFNAINNLNVSKNIVFVPYPYTLKDAKAFITKNKKNSLKNPRTDYTFAIELKSEKKVIGNIGIHKIDFFQKDATLGYWLNENYWNKKIMTEALDRVIRFAFSTLKLQRLNLSAFEYNAPSSKLAEKFNFVLEGTRKKSKRSIATKKFHDVKEYGLLKENWKLNRK